MFFSVFLGLGISPVLAENESISKQRPQYEEIKEKLSVKERAKIEAKKAEERLAKHSEMQKTIVRENTKPKDLDKSKKMVSAMPDMAKEQRKQLEKIREQIDKRMEAKKLKIEKFVAKSDIGKPSKEKIRIPYTKN